MYPEGSAAAGPLVVLYPASLFLRFSIGWRIVVGEPESSGFRNCLQSLGSGVGLLCAPHALALKSQEQTSAPKPSRTQNVEIQDPTPDLPSMFVFPAVRRRFAQQRARTGFPRQGRGVYQFAVTGLNW
jgi:hypothetical protein